MKITIQTLTKKIEFELSIIIFILLVVLKYIVIFTLMLRTWNSIMSGMLKEIFKKGMMV
jgi:uncharacterized membrane protein